MKKLFALILAVVMIATMSTTAFAAEIDQDTAAPKDGSTSVYFEVDPTYTVTIPATVELNKVEDNGTVTYENDYTLTAEAGVRLKKNEYIEVTVASDFEMTTTEGATLAYTITAEGAAVANNGVVAEFATDKAEQTATIHIAANDPDYAGEYKDTVTFTLAVVDTTVDFVIVCAALPESVNCKVEKGTTWAEWVNSPANVYGVNIAGGSLFIGNIEYHLPYIKASDTILEMTYEFA